MSLEQNRTSKSLTLLPILALVCFAGLTVLASEPCKTHRLEVPDPSTLNLKDGENVVSALDTPSGRLEAKVTVRGKVISAPHYSLDGKPLRRISESEIPESIRECLKSAPTAQNASFTSGELAKSEDSKLSSIARVAYSKAPKCVVVLASCGTALNGKQYCVARACCTVDGSTACEFAAVIY